VARVATVEAIPAGTVSYQVRELHGSPAHFPIREATLRDALEADWTCLLRDDRALSLAPVLACLADGVGHGLFLAREVGIAPGQMVETVSLTFSAKRKIKAPAG
jgi:hypothetical protein